MSFLNKQPPNPNIGTYHEWKRQSIHEFARKFVSNEFSGFFSKKMTVNEGEGLLLMQGGKAISENLLGAGVYPLGNYFQASSVSGSSVAVLINTGEVSLQFSGDGIITCDGMCAGYEVTLSVELRKPDGGLDFYANVMKGCDAVSVFDLQSRFSKVVLTAVQEVIANHNGSELSTSSQALRNELWGKLVGHYFNGLDISSVDYVRCSCEQWADVQQARIASKIGIEKIKAGMTLTEYQTAAAVAEIEGKGVIAKTEQRINHDLKRTEKGFQLEIDRMQLEADIAEIKALQDLKARWNALKRSDQAELARNLAGLPPEVRFYIMGGTVADDLTFQEMKMMQSLTAEQILARNAVDPASIAAVANAIASKERLQDLERFSDKQLDQAERNAERMADITKTVLKTNAETTSAFAASMGPGTTVVTSGFGNPVAVNPPRVRYCPHCESRMNADDKECPNCAYESD